MMSGTSVEEAVKRISKWAAAYYTHVNSFYKMPISHKVASCLASKSQSQFH